MTNREEVAKKLREIWNEHGCRVMTSDTAVYKLSCVVGAQGKQYEFFFNRLADLIDPTCENKQVEVNKMAPIEFKADNFICSNCGETFCADSDGINAPIDWSYCPHCGARVVRDES